MACQGFISFESLRGLRLTLAGIQESRWVYPYLERTRRYLKLLFIFIIIEIQNYIIILASPLAEALEALVIILITSEAQSLAPSSNL